MTTLISVLHIASCILLILVVLIQSGKGAEISASLGGSSQTIFGSSGGANFFTRFTGATAAVFMITSLLLTIRGGENRSSLMEHGATPPAAQTAPAAQPAAPAAPAQPAAPAAPAAPKAQ